MKVVSRTKAIDELVRHSIDNSTDNLLYVVYKFGTLGYEMFTIDELAKDYNICFAENPTVQEFQVIDDTLYH